MGQRRLREMMARREVRCNKWAATLSHEDQRLLLKHRPNWIKATPGRLTQGEEGLYHQFVASVLGGGDEGLECAREMLLELEAAERHCRPGQFGKYMMNMI